MYHCVMMFTRLMLLCQVRFAVRFITNKVNGSETSGRTASSSILVALCQPTRDLRRQRLILRITAKAKHTRIHINTLP